MLAKVGLHIGENTVLEVTGLAAHSATMTSPTLHRLPPELGPSQLPWDTEVVV